MPLRPEINEILRNASFDCIAQLCQMHINGGLINALVKRWRPESHIFHLPCGECTITLEDVAMLLGLRCNGIAVTGSTNPNTLALQNMCEQLLGSRPKSNDIEGSKIRLKWITKQLGWLTANSDIRIAQHARGYVLSLLGHILMPNKSNSPVHGKFLQLLVNVHEIRMYSWGSSCLALLYRGLDRGSRHDAKEIYGCIILLQFMWRPYEDEAIDVIVPHDLKGERLLWLTVSPLICFEVVEWHATDCVMRQYNHSEHTVHCEEALVVCGQNY
ncbi:serine/threonine-protein phosphatase 7 long form homolog [Abrus precatorius]|uniref:Serine/threonine-protein phosphatase 7 long form homolog n=1 Tax=Abrus precatorius TaxID=3816 RepID=A0A8B8MB61_ABRPR|nr:serine/threonine-protein phosphatase 7 long form homolog [Abrus precatorius]